MPSNDCSSVCKLTKNGCITEVQFHEVKYFWILSNFDFLESEGSDLLSPTFSAATNRQVEWFLRIKPNGETLAKDTVSLYVCLKTDGRIVCIGKKNPDGTVTLVSKKIQMKASVSVLDREQKEIYCVGSSDINKVKINEYSFSTSASVWGKKEFLKKDENFRNNLLSNQKLTIICTIIFSFVHDAFTNTIHSCNVAPLYPNVPVCNLVENLGMLLENHDLADIILCVKDKKKEFPAHKNILAARSSVFAAMFKYNLKENETNRIEIEDMNEEVVAEMLRYIYTGKCENTEKLADGLLAAADKYDLNRLKMICAEALYKTLSIYNAANILALADLHSIMELKSETMKFIVARFTEVAVSTAWKNILVSNPQLINEVCQAVADLSPAPKRRRIQDTSVSVSTKP